LTGEVNSSEETQLAHLILELVALGGGKIPNQKIIGKSKNALARRVTEAGGLRYLNSIIMLAPADLFPFYLAILTQTSGNPMAIRTLTRDCVQPHSFRSDLTLVCWEKPRSGTEQKVDFPIGREWSAASLVSRISRLNENLVPLVERSARNSLFLAYSHHQARVPCFQMFHHLLGDFIARHQLGLDFDFKDLRRAGARAHQKTSGSIFLVKKRLNHKSVRTTARYLDQVEIAETSDQVIFRFQGELARRALQPDSEAAPREEKERSDKSNGHIDTIFGFKCKDPIAGIAL